MPTVCGLLRLRLAVAPLEGQAERDVLFEASLHFLEERQDGGRCRRDVLEIARGKRRELRGGAPEVLAQCRIEVRFPQCCYAAAGIEESLLDLIGRRVLASGLLHLRRRRALQIEERPRSCASPGAVTGFCCAAPCAGSHVPSAPSDAIRTSTTARGIILMDCPVDSLIIAPAS